MLNICCVMHYRLKWAFHCRLLLRICLFVDFRKKFQLRLLTDVATNGSGLLFIRIAAILDFVQLVVL
jgi:hypothetical protein